MLNTKKINRMNEDIFDDKAEPPYLQLTSAFLIFCFFSHKTFVVVNYDSNFLITSFIMMQ